MALGSFLWIGIMAGDLFVIMSTVPEKISNFTSKLRLFTSNFLFFSGIHSFTENASQLKLRLVVIDNSDNTFNVAEAIQVIRRHDISGAVKVLVIVSDDDTDSGVDALVAGANDYLPLGLVSRELVARVRMRLSMHEAQTSDSRPESPDADLGDIYPLEDRYILKTAIHHIKNQNPLIKTVNDLSFYVSKSETEINRAFKMHLGLTAFEYMRNHRIDVAKIMLSQTRFPVTQIADNVGYSSVANFSTAFKSIAGVSPSAYRRQFLLSK